MKPLLRTLGMITVLGLVFALISAPAFARSRPTVTGLSTHHGAYWGSSVITVRGHNFVQVKKVLFGARRGQAVHVLSSTRLRVRDPYHSYGKVHVRVVTSAGTSSTSSASRFIYTRPTMNSKIQGGLTARQEQRIAARVRASHKGVHTAHRSGHWTAAMGVTAMRRARSWLGMPYSWAAGNSRGPTLGVCAHNGGDMDCHVVGFDCSGLALYAWAPYKSLVHYAATQRSRAGKFHPSIGQLMPGDLVFFSGYIANGIGHVAVYEGRGNVIQAEQSGTRVMRSRLIDVIADSGRYRGATRPMSTGRQATRPHLSSMTSQRPVKGGYLSIRGKHLSTATSVSVDGTMVYSFHKRTASRLIIKVPAHRAGRVDVAVSNPWGTAHHALTYVAAPKASAMTPSQGPDSGGTTVTIEGKNLTTVSKVTVGTTSAAFSVAAANRLTVTMPAHDPGAATVTLYSPFGTSNQLVYTFIALASTDRTVTRRTSPTVSTVPPTSTPPTTGVPTTGTSTTGAPTTGAPTTSSSSVDPPTSTATPSEVP